MFWTKSRGWIFSSAAPRQVLPLNDWMIIWTVDTLLTSTPVKCHWQELPVYISPDSDGRGHILSWALQWRVMDLGHTPPPGERAEDLQAQGLPATWPASRELKEHKYVDVCKNSGENHLKHSERRTKISYLQLICLMYTIFDTSVWCLNVKVTV